MPTTKLKNKRDEGGLLKKDLDAITRVLSRYSEVSEGILFGSRAKGNYEKASDVDLCLKGKKLNSELLSQIHWELEEGTLIPYFFVVVHYETLSNPDLKDHIDRVGVSIYKA
jgi:predicted nucleotidyltransferase